MLSNERLVCPACLKNYLPTTIARYWISYGFYLSYNYFFHYRHVCRPAVQPEPVPVNQQVPGQVAEQGLPQIGPSAAHSAIEDDVFNITVAPDTDDLVELEETPEDPQVEQGNINSIVGFTYWNLCF